MTRHGERGQALVEFAFAGTIALTMIFGMIEFGRALYAYDQIGQAARVATRYAIVNAARCNPANPSNPSASNPANCATEIEAYLIAKTNIEKSLLVPAYVGGPDIAVSWKSSDGNTDCYDPGCAVSVGLRYRFAFVSLPLPTQTLTSSSSMTISQ